MPVLLTSDDLDVEPLLAWRLLLFPLLPFLFLLFLLGRLRLRLLTLRWLRRLRRCRRRWRWPCRCGRRRALLLALARRRSRRSWSGLARPRLGLRGLRTIVGLYHRRTIIPYRWRSWLVGLGTIRLCRRTHRLGPVIRCRRIRLRGRGPVRLGTIVGWIRRRGWRTIRLSRNSSAGALVRSGRISRSIRRLVRWRTAGLTRSRRSWLPRLVARTTHVRCCRFAWRRLFHHWLRYSSSRTQAPHFAFR